MLDALQESGGRAEWSDRIVLLDEYLTREHEGQPVMTIDWGIANNLLALSGGRMELTEASYAFEGLQSRLNGSPREVLKRSLSGRSTWFVLHSPAATQFGNARPRFFSALNSLGRRAELVQTLRDPEGRALYEVYAAAKVR